MSFLSELDEALESFNEDEDGEAIEDGKPYWGMTGWDALGEFDGETFEVEVGGNPVTVKVLETSYGTYEDDTYIILEAGGKTYRKFGWTASHDGTYWEGSFNEVFPEQKTITVWRNVK